MEDAKSSTRNEINSDIESSAENNIGSDKKGDNGNNIRKDTGSTARKLSEYNSIIKEQDEIYRDIARMLGLPDCAFWILYALRDNEKPVTQSEICNTIYQPKQTVNSSLKKLEREGIINLTEMQDRRSKKVHLTPRGIKLAERTVDYVIWAEQRALSGLTDKEQNMFMDLFRRYTELLKNSMNELKEKKETV